MDRGCLHELRSLMYKKHSRVKIIQDYIICYGISIEIAFDLPASVQSVLMKHRCFSYPGQSIATEFSHERLFKSPCAGKYDIVVFTFEPSKKLIGEVDIDTCEISELLFSAVSV